MRGQTQLLPHSRPLILRLTAPQGFTLHVTTQLKPIGPQFLLLFVSSPFVSILQQQSSSFLAPDAERKCKQATPDASWQANQETLTLMNSWVAIASCKIWGFSAGQYRGASHSYSHKLSFILVGHHEPDKELGRTRFTGCNSLQAQYRRQLLKVRIPIEALMLFANSAVGANFNKKEGGEGIWT